MNMNRLRRLQHAYVGWRLTKTSIPRHPNLSPTRNYHTEDDLHPSTRARSTTQCTMRSSSPTTRISPSPSSVTEELYAVWNVAEEQVRPQEGWPWQQRSHAPSWDRRES